MCSFRIVHAFFFLSSIVEHSLLLSHQPSPAHWIAIISPVAQPGLPPVSTHSVQRPASVTWGSSWMATPVSPCPFVSALTTATVTTAIMPSGLMRDAVSCVFVTPKCTTHTPYVLLWPRWILQSWRWGQKLYAAPSVDMHVHGSSDTHLLTSVTTMFVVSVSTCKWAWVTRSKVLMPFRFAYK